MGNLRAVLNSDLASPAFSPQLLKHFKSVRGGIQPSTYLRERVNFTRKDVQSEPLPADTYHAAIATNVLYHYTRRGRNKFMANILRGVVDGGIFMPEMPAAPSQRAEYDRWYEALPGNFPLQPVTCGDQTFPGIYQKVAS
ncbi:MAG: class I SAM-dependent methyltransferase [Candidatus Saccharimonadales bacterium]